MYEGVNPKWRTWFDQQSPAVVAAVATKWEETASDPDIVEVAGKKSSYARLFKLLAYCAEIHSYDFTTGDPQVAPDGSVVFVDRMAKA